ncbi:MAG TPA: hypothetical protein VM925_11170 [Labilithrix sp.]|nr:hypothetical protein [Labilithrix sp.]
MNRATWGLSFALLAACGSHRSGPPAGPSDAGSETSAPAVDAPDAAVKRPLELHFAFVHGVHDPDSYARADGDLADLEKEVLTRIEERRAAYEAAQAVALNVTSTRLNLYTDLAGNVPSPGTDEGSKDEVAAKWRGQLVTKLAAAFPNGEKNIVFVGHSTGARAAMEVAADVGGADNALGAGKWGFVERIAGVVSVHGMLDALGGYATLGGVVPFSVGCDVAKPSGWCGYAGSISAIPAADWVATQRHSLVLTSSVDDGRCGTMAWKEPSDQLLPIRAQGNPAAFGLGIASDRDGVFRPSHGVQFGQFCHSDITNQGSPRHAEAIGNASLLVAEWLFELAPRVVNATPESQTYDTPVLDGLTMSAPFTFLFSCPAGTLRGDTLAAVGNCHHPGSSDGDDHAMTAEQLVFSTDAHCGGSVMWKNVHDHPHAGTIWFKSYARTAGGLLSTLE